MLRRSVLGEVPVLGGTPALKVRPESKTVVAVAGQRPGQPQLGRGDDEDRQAELAAGSRGGRS